VVLTAIGRGDEVHARTRVTLVGIAGPSCAGKSTVTENLKNRVPFSPVPLDHFFRSTPAGFAHGFANWEIAESLMLDHLADCLLGLKRGESVLIPRAPWTEDFSLQVDPAPLVLVEGFLLFACDTIRELLDCRIFIDIPEEEQLRRRCTPFGRCCPRSRWRRRYRCMCSSS
jgi:uridine kinase